jgi:type IV pilus assembly protein PilB
METKNSIISLITEQAILDERTLQAVVDAHEKTGQSLITLLKKQNLLNEEQLTKVIAGSGGIEFINLAPEMVEPMVAHLIPYEMASRYNVIPIKREDDKLRVAMSSPLNLSVRDQIEMKTGYKVIPVAATPTAIKHAVRYHFDVTNVTKQAIVSMRLQEGPDKNLQSNESEPVKVGDSPIAKLVSSIIGGGIDTRASDIHIEPQGTDIRVRYRVDGILRSSLAVPSSVQQEMVSHIKIMANMDISEHRIPQDGHVTTTRDGKIYDLRISSLPGITGEKIVIRILDKDADRWSIDEIVSSSEDNQKLRSIVNNPYGMLLLTGPTGCGKTTTLYAILQILNTPERNIVTVEDPVEYRLDGITQVQISPVAGRTFGLALRSILRQDPDIILIGEIRDVETAEIAVSAALTGHLVLSTLHTNDAVGAISRLTNLGIPSFLVASALLGTVTQRLIRISCPQCRQTYTVSEQELKLLRSHSNKDENLELYRTTGCEACCQTGYRGRKSIYEILRISPDIRKMIVHGDSDNTIKEQAIKEGMRTLRDSTIAEVLNGVTTMDELTRVVEI